MLESLRLGMHFRPIKPNYLHEELLHDAMTPQHIDRQMTTFGGKGDQAILLIFDKPPLGELFDHRSCGAFGDAHHSSQARDGAVTVRSDGFLAQREDRLEVVLDSLADGLGGHGCEKERLIDREQAAKVRFTCPEVL